MGNVSHWAAEGGTGRGGSTTTMLSLISQQVGSTLQEALSSLALSNQDRNIIGFPAIVDHVEGIGRSLRIVDANQDAEVSRRYYDNLTEN